MMSLFTQRVKGGKLNVIVWPRMFLVVRLRAVSLSIKPTRVTTKLCYQAYGRCVLLALGSRHHGQAAVAFIVNRAHSKNDIILRNLECCTVYVAHALGVFPIRADGRAPDNFMGTCASARGWIPRQCRVVFQVLGYDVDICGRCRC